MKTLDGVITNRNLWTLSQNLIAAAAVILAATIYVDATFLVINVFQPLFLYDGWESVDDYLRYVQGTYRWYELFSQHNEHRIFFPRLIFFLDFFYNHGLDSLSLFVSYILQVLQILILGFIAATLSRNAKMTIVMVSSIIILLFSFGQSENFVSGFQVQFIGVYTAATLAFVLYSRAVLVDGRRVRTLLMTLVAFFMSFVATFSMSNGVLSCFVLIILALLLRAGILQIVSTMIVAAGCAAAYFYQFNLIPGLSPPGYVLQHPLEFIAYVFVYIGGCCGSFGVDFAGVFGGIGVTLTAIAVIRGVLHRELNPARAALIGVMLFILLTAIATGFGRAFFGTDQALQSRYMTPSAVFWSAQVVYWGSLGPGSKLRRVSLAIFCFIASVAVSGAVRSHISQRAEVGFYFDLRNDISNALLSGIDSPDILTQAYPDPAKLRRLAPFLDKQHLNIFYRSDANLRQKSLHTAFASIDNTLCSGAFFQYIVDPKSPKVASVGGWAWDRSHSQPVDRVVIVDSHDMIVGFASAKYRYRPSFPFLSHIKSDWSGVTRITDGAPLTAYADLDHESIGCKLEGDSSSAEHN